MARDGSGTYNRPESDYVFDTVIDETKVNNDLNQIATALTGSIAKDGQTNPSANLPMNSKKHTGVAAGTARTDYADVASVQDGGYLWGGTGGGTVDVITFSLSPTITAYATGMQVAFKSSGANTGAVTVNINSVGAVAITKNGTTALAASDILSGQMVKMVYDGTQFQINTSSESAASETVTGVVERATQAETNTGTDTTRYMSPANLKSHLTTPNPIGATTAGTGKFTTLEATTSLKLATGATPTEFSTDGTLAGNSDTAIPTEKAVKTYADGKLSTVKIVNATRDMTAATGTQAITGAGGTPIGVRVIYAKTGTTIGGTGHSDGTTDRTISTNASNQWNSTAIIIRAEQSGGVEQQATLQSLDSNGCTLSWVKSGSPSAGTLDMSFEFIF